MSELIEYRAGEPMLSPRAVALLVGVTEDEVRDLARTQGTDAAMLPPEWIERGRARATEAKLHTGCSDMVTALSYWQVRNRGDE